MNRFPKHADESKEDCSVETVFVEGDAHTGKTAFLANFSQTPFKSNGEQHVCNVVVDRRSGYVFSRFDDKDQHCASLRMIEIAKSIIKIDHRCAELLAITSQCRALLYFVNSSIAGSHTRHGHVTEQLERLRTILLFPYIARVSVILVLANFQGVYF